jgi:hypothetical protein
VVESNLCSSSTTSAYGELIEYTVHVHNAIGTQHRTKYKTTKGDAIHETRSCFPLHMYPISQVDLLKYFKPLWYAFLYKLPHYIVTVWYPYTGWPVVDFTKRCNASQLDMRRFVLRNSQRGLWTMSRKLRGVSWNRPQLWLTAWTSTLSGGCIIWNGRTWTQ